MVARRIEAVKNPDDLEVIRQCIKRLDRVFSISSLREGAETGRIVDPFAWFCNFISCHALNLQIVSLPVHITVIGFGH